MPRDGVRFNFRLLDAFRHAPTEESAAESAEHAPAPVSVTAPPVESPVAPDADDRAPDSAETVLVAQARQDPTAFGKLYELYVDRIYAYIYHRVGNIQDAEDLTARTFYRALDHLDSYEDRGAPFAAWLFRIAHNLVVNWHRDRSRRSFLALDRLWSHSVDGSSPERQVEQEEERTALWQAIGRLPEERRNLLLFKFNGHMSNLEIGELMNKSESAIKSLYFRTLAALRQDLEARGWRGGPAVDGDNVAAPEAEGEST